jgi:segregation and condensation protein B
MSDTVDAIHALLFVADAPTSIADLAAALGLTEGQAEQAIDVLRTRLAAMGPVQLIQIAGGLQLSTKPEYLPQINEFLKPRRQKMSRSLLEVLAVIAYRQPMTIAEIDAVRGVQSDHAVRSLMERRLIQDVGRRHAPGRPVLYGTTRQFLHAFQLNDLKELPLIEEKLAFPAQELPAPSAIATTS